MLNKNTKKNIMSNYCEYDEWKINTVSKDEQNEIKRMRL